MKNGTLYLLALSSGVLLSLAWPNIGGLTPLLFIALVPLLLVEDRVLQEKKEGRKKRLLPYSYITFLSFNLFTTWWVWNASVFGAVAAITINALFSAIIFNLYHYVRGVLGDVRGFFGLLVLWLGWEYFHMDWDLSWPWLSLGNGLATFPEWVQWYEYTGISGGTFWILLLNTLGFYAVKSYREHPEDKRKFATLSRWYVFFLAVPMVISCGTYFSTEDQGTPVEVVVIQPNIDPYNEKFNGKPSEAQVKEMMDLARKVVSPQTALVIAPETAIPQSFEESRFRLTPEYKHLRDFLNDFPNCNILIGASTFRIYQPNETPGPTARYAQERNFFYDYCNTGVYLNDTGEPSYYHKSKMVPGVEKMPFPGFFRYFQELAFNLGGTTGSLASQPNRVAFQHSMDSSLRVAPIICYESIYGDFTGGYVTQGDASVFSIITNDGWWGDTPGYKQHMNYGRLRAIENRRSIARSANTGISCFINQRGDVSQPTDWWVPTAIKGQVFINQEKTFYAQHGDFLGRTSLLFAGFLLLYTFIRKKKLNQLR